MRARNLKPEFFRDRLIASLPMHARLTYQALWIVADDHGTAPLEADQLKADLFLKWDDITPELIRDGYAKLQAHGRITVHRVPNGDLFAIIKNWKKHQRPKKPSQFRYPTEGEPVSLPYLPADALPAFDQAGEPIIRPLPAGTERPAKTPHFSKEDYDQLYEQWVAMVGEVSYGQVKKAFAAVKPSLTNGLEAIRLFSIHRKNLNDRERGFANFPKFAQDIAHWLRLAVMDLFDEQGDLTERGRLVSGG